MDYSFYVKRIGTIPEHVRIKLLSGVQGLKFSDTSKNFRSHKGYSVTESKTVDQSTMLDIVPYLPECLKDKTPIDIEIGVLDPNSILSEHTDNNPPTNRGWLVQRIHKIHVVLQSEYGWCEHRRSESKEQPSRMLMEQGGVYLFNNYIFHSVGNPGSIERIHLVAQYRDDNWDLKLELYKHLKLTGLQPY